MAMSVEGLHLKPAHAAVLRALELANAAHGRLVRLAEIVERLQPSDELLMRETYAKSLRLAARSVLMLFQGRGLVFAARGAAGRLYYGSVRVLDPARAAAPPGVSRRQRVLALVNEAVRFYESAVRCCDVVQYATQAGEMHDLTTAQVSQAMRNLVDTGELRIVRQVRGSARGFYLYLPSDLPTEQFETDRTMSWLEEVAEVFTGIWEDRMREADATGALPRPISTPEVRRCLKLLPHPHPNLQDQRSVANALLRLATTKRPLIRQLKRDKFRTTMWIPAAAGVPEHAVAQGFANDTERIGEAIRRAGRRLRRPVTRRDIDDEIGRDHSLRPNGISSTARVLMEAAKETIAAGKGGRNARRLQFVHHVGLADGASYYCSEPPGTASFAAAKAFVKLRQLSGRWDDLAGAEDPEELARCLLPTAATGRALLMEQETRLLRAGLDDLARSEHAHADVRRTAERLAHEVREKENEARKFLMSHRSCHGEVLSDVVADVPGLTSHELIDLLFPFYPPARRLTRSHKIMGLMGDAIRRVPNPQFLSQFDKNPNRAAKYLFDRTDTLLYIAIQWGGRCARIHSHTARHELGRLRDVRFILPALTSPDFTMRLTATACLAFLPGAAGIAALKRAAAEDVEPNVRLSAEWALLLTSGDMEKFVEAVRM
jgi:hypothetical protein